MSKKSRKKTSQGLDDQHDVLRWLSYVVGTKKNGNWSKVFGKLLPPPNQMRFRLTAAEKGPMITTGLENLG